MATKTNIIITEENFDRIFISVNKREGGYAIVEVSTFYGINYTPLEKEGVWKSKSYGYYRNLNLPGWIKPIIKKGNFVQISEIQWDENTGFVKLIGKEVIPEIKITTEESVSGFCSDIYYAGRLYITTEVVTKEYGSTRIKVSEKEVSRKVKGITVAQKESWEKENPQPESTEIVKGEEVISSSIDIVSFTGDEITVKEISEVKVHSDCVWYSLSCDIEAGTLKWKEDHNTYGKLSYRSTDPTTEKVVKTAIVDKKTKSSYYEQESEDGRRIDKVYYDYDVVTYEVTCESGKTYRFTK